MRELRIGSSGIALWTILCLSLVACGGGGSSAPTLVEEEEEELTPVQLPMARGLMPDLAEYDGLFEDVHFSGNGNCASCHNDQGDGAQAVMVDSTGRDLSIGTAWQSSMMANSARDPYWHAVVASELALYPNLEEEINDTCSRCHAPIVNEVGRRTGQPVQILDSGSVAEGNFVQGVLSKSMADTDFKHAMEGVSCSLCHQIADDGNLGEPEGMTGEFHIEQYGEADIAERPAYGQYDGIEVAYMQIQSNFKPVYGAHMNTSESCASCHNLVSESVDTQGQALADPVHFPEQMVYSEWEASSFAGADGQTCQDCHMPVVPEPVYVAAIGADIKRDDFAEHTFLGANTVMLNMMDQFRIDLGIDSSVDFGAAIERNRAFLGTAAELNILSSNIDNDKLLVNVEVINKTGHKLPSGYHSRRVYLHVVVTDNNGQLVYENGAINSDGSIDGLIEDVSPSAYEPHYNIITKSTEVQVYQSVMGNSDNQRTHSLLNGSSYLKDNRLLPSGFDKNQVSDDIKPAGAAISDNNFGAARDTVQYQIPVESSGPYNVLVELNYQPLSYGHLQSLFQRSDNIDEVDRFRTLYDAITLHHETIAVTQFTVEQ